MNRLVLILLAACTVLTLLAVSTVSAAVNVAVTYHLDSQWTTGFQSTFTIKNRDSATLNAWQLEFDMPHNVTSIWDAQISSHTGAHYVIRGVDWNKNIAANAQVSFGYVAATVGMLSQPQNCKVNGVAVNCNGSNPAATATATKKAKTKTPTPTVKVTKTKKPKKTKTPAATATRTATPIKTATSAPTVSPTAGASPTPGNPSAFPARVFAPYVDMLLWPTPNIAQFAQQSGAKYYTLAFIVSGNTCTASWGGVIALTDDFYHDQINALRANGGDVIVSFGGANGIELAHSCTSVATLQAQYQAAIDRYNITRMDLDIEGGSLADPTSVDRRNKAVAALQAYATAHGKTLNVSYTLPVMPTGLTQDGINLLTNAIANGVRVDVVNVMAMDYGGPSVADPHKMGDEAISAATNLQSQLKTLYPSKTDVQLWRMVGVTPMIGLNDVSPEVFTLPDAQKLLIFAQQKNIARLAFWSAGRDHSCPNNGAYVASDCSGITQQPWDFSKQLKPFTQ